MYGRIFFHKEQAVELFVSLQLPLYLKIGEAERIPATNSQIECDANPIEAEKVSTAGKPGILNLFPKIMP